MVEGRAEQTATVGSEVEPWLAQVLAQVASGAPIITPATRLIEDLGLDSLALAELGEHIAVKAGRELSAEELSNVNTVDDLQRLVDEGRNHPRLPSYARLARPYTFALPAALRN